MKNNKKGFTLAELLIVVAIIAVLVAIAIPIFTTQLEKSRESTDIADARDYYAEIATALVSGDLNASHTTINVGAKLNATATYDTNGFLTKVVVSGWKAHQTQSKWQSGDQQVAGVTIASATDWKDANTITYTFSKDSENDVYLSAVAGTKTS